LLLGVFMPSFDSITTRMPNGVTNAATWQTMGSAGTPDPSWSHMYHNDFDTFNAADFSLNEVGQGTVALTGGDGGVLSLTNATGQGNAITMQLAQASFVLKPGKATFFKFAGVLSDAINDIFFVGLAQSGAATLTAVTDGILISKAAGSSQLILRSSKGGLVTQLALPAIDAPVSGVPFELGLFVDAQGNLAAFFNPTTGSTSISAAATVQGRGRVAAMYSLPASGVPLSLTSVVLAPIVSITNSLATSHVLGIDYLTVSRER
jgi:hypothetical protein